MISGNAGLKSPFVQKFFAGVVFFALIAVPMAAGEGVPAVPAAASSSAAGLVPLEQSKAYKRYSARPQTDLSQLIYLIDRFSEADILILYGDFQVDAPFAAGIARWFISRNYEGQTAEAWVDKWCKNTFPQGKPINVRLADGDIRPAVDILKDELNQLRAISPE